MNISDHPWLEAHRLACVELIQLLNSDWYEIDELLTLIEAIHPWNVERVEAGIQELYRASFARHFQVLAGHDRTQDCPADFLRGFRAIAMAQAMLLKTLSCLDASSNEAANDEEKTSGRRRHEARTHH